MSGIQSHHFRQIEARKVKARTDSIFLGFKITVDSDYSNKIKRHLLLGRKNMKNLDIILKRSDFTLLTMVYIVKSFGLHSNHCFLIGNTFYFSSSFFLFLQFAVITSCLGVDFFEFILWEICCASYICKFMSSAKFRKISDIFFPSSRFSVLCFLFSFLDSDDINTRSFVFQKSLSLCSIFLNHFLSAVQMV